MPEVFSACPTTHHLLSSWLALSVASLGPAWAGTEPLGSLLVRTGYWASGCDGQCHSTGTCNEVTEQHELSLLSWYWHRYFWWALMDFRHALGGCFCIPHQGVDLYDLLQPAALTMGTVPTSTYLLGAVPARAAGLDV